MFDSAEFETSPVLAELTALAAQRRQLEFRESELLLQALTENVCLRTHGHSTAGWLANMSQQGLGMAKRQIRVAEMLHSRYRVLAQAFAEGRVGWNHVVAFERTANPRVRDHMIELLPDLIQLAEVATFDRWSQEIRGIAEQLDQDGGYDPSKDRANNELRLTPLSDGFVQVSGRLVGEVALTIRSLINAETERVLARCRADAEQADCRSGDAVPLPSRAQAAAEALGELLERGAGVADSEGKMLVPEMVVIYHETTGQLTDIDGAWLSPTILRWILAAAIIRPLEMSQTGDPLHMGQALRYANRQQRRALTSRDGGCIFPGCTRLANWCDAHHVDEWENGGPTDIENLALLCRHHHRVTHRPGWIMSRHLDPEQFDPDEVRFRWRTPDGRFIHSQRHHRKQQPRAA